MPKLPIIWLRTGEAPSLPDLVYHRPALSLSGLQLGVDNLRHDVALSPSLVKDLTAQITRHICRFGEVETLLDMAPKPANAWQFVTPLSQPVVRQPGLAELKSSLIATYQAILNRAKAQGNPCIDLLGRLAVLKFIRSELQAQFSRILEQCRMKAKALDGSFYEDPIQVREQLSSFQVRKKIVIRRTGQEILQLLSDIEKETLARTRRSLLGEFPPGTNSLFLNPLVLTEDGRDDFLCAERYYMFGNFDRDPDRFASLRELALKFLRDLGYGDGMEDDQLEHALNVPENAQAVVGNGFGEDATAEDRHCNNRLELWTRMLQRHNTLPQVVASYEAVPLLAEYASRVNPQQLKNALIDRKEAERVEMMFREGRLSCDRLRAATARVSSCREGGRRRFAARLLHDLCCYHRDMRGLEAINSGFDSVNLVADEKTRELSSLNGMLYEFLPPEDQKPSEERVLGHVILKADVRDSSRLTHSLMAKGMNAASYFSLNFYDPVNKLLAKFGATKVFLEGDAIILALLERETEVNLAVSRACVLAWDIVSLLQGYNELLQRSGLPPMEVGLGIAYQDSPPLYLMDGERRIMISDAINVSDRLSSCSKRVRKRLAEEAGVFQVYTLQSESNQEALADAPAQTLAADELRLSFNVGGICLSEPAFLRLRQEITLSRWRANRDTPGFGGPWVDPEGEFFLGTVPVAQGIFRRIAIRKSRIPRVDVRDLSILRWTDVCYYEVCAHPAVYSALPGEKSASARTP